jgi:alkyl sulfatase BDS1-like metallo-beta-lactamase superfamily hydrolase
MTDNTDTTERDTCQLDTGYKPRPEPKQVSVLGFDIGYTDLELNLAFELVKPAENWKYPIDAVIPAHFQRVVTAAIDHYAGGGAEVLESDLDPHKVRVIAPGYYAEIGA